MKLDKITEQESTPRRRYEDACGAAHALDLVGERWALLVMRELMLGPRRFSDLRAALPGLSANVLTQRLQGLEQALIIKRVRDHKFPDVHYYELTPWGYESEPIFQALGRWAARSPQHDPSLPLSAVSLFMSFRTMIDPARAAGLEAVVGFEIGKEPFNLRLRAGQVLARRGASSEAQAVLTGAAPAIAAAVYGGVPLALLEAQGALAVAGDRALAERFVTLFPLPSKVTP